MQSSGHTMAFDMVELRLQARDRPIHMLVLMSHAKKFSGYWNMPLQKHPPAQILSGMYQVHGQYMFQLLARVFRSTMKAAFDEGAWR